MSSWKTLWNIILLNLRAWEKYSRYRSGSRFEAFLIDPSRDRKIRSIRTTNMHTICIHFHNVLLHSLRTVRTAQHRDVHITRYKVHFTQCSHECISHSVRSIYLRGVDLIAQYALVNSNYLKIDKPLALEKHIMEHHFTKFKGMGKIFPVSIRFEVRSLSDRSGSRSKNTFDPHH